MSGPGHEMLPAPPWLLAALHVLTLTLHLAAMSALVGVLSLVGLRALRERGGDALTRRLAVHFPSALAATVTLGVAPLLFLQLTHPREVYSAAIAVGWAWLGLVGLVLLAYFALYAVAFGRRADGALRWPGLLLAALGLLFLASIVLASTFALAEDPALVARLHATDPRGLGLNPDLGAWLPRWAHDVTGMVALGGFALAVVGRRDAAARRLGTSAFVGGTVVAALAGLGLLLSRADLVAPLMRSAGAPVLGAAVLLAAGAAWAFLANRPVLAGGALLASLLGMVVVRHVVRDLALGAAGDLSGVPVRPQWGVFGLFVACLLVAAGLVAWLVSVDVRAARRAGT